MFALLFDLEDYATTYRATRDAYLKAANELKLATGALWCTRLPFGCGRVVVLLDARSVTRCMLVCLARAPKLTAHASTGPYKAARDAYVAATATYTKSLYE